MNYTHRRATLASIVSDHTKCGLLFVATLFVLTPFARKADADIQYIVTDLGTFGSAGGTPYGINSIGQVTGVASNQAFLWTPLVPNGTSGTMYNLGTLGGLTADGHGINDSGQVTGTSYLPGNTISHAFVWTPTVSNGNSGTMHDLGTFGGQNSSGGGINASGQVTGGSSLSAIYDAHAYMFNGTLHDVGTLGGSVSFGVGINAIGQIVGEAQTTGNLDIRAFLWTPSTSGGTTGTMSNLGTLGGPDSHGVAINASGLVTGLAQTSTYDFHAFLWTPTVANGTSGTMLDLGTLGGQLPPGLPFSEGSGINASGEVIGYSIINANGDQDAFRWTNGTGMVDLNSLIDPVSGWDLEDANAINDFGQITGSGEHNGQIHAFLLTPVPEPTGLVLGTIAVVLVAGSLLIHRRTAISNSRR